MKLFFKVFLLTLAAMAVSATAKADPVPNFDCTLTVVMAPNTTGNSSNVCTLVASPGFFLSNLVLTGTDDYMGLISGSPMVSFTGAISQDPTLPSPFQTPTFCTVQTSGMNSLPCSVLPNPNVATNLTDMSATTFTFQLIDVSNTVSEGVVTDDLVALNLSAIGQTFNPNAMTGTTPEPSSLGLTAAGLLAIGLLCRKK